MSGVEWIDRLSDTDLRALAYIAGQFETFTEGTPPPHAGNLSRSIQQEQTRRDQARRVASVGRTFISLMAEIEHPMAYPMTPAEQLDEATGGRR